MLVDFPDDVLLEIATWLSQSDLSALRLVSVQLCLATSPVFYREFTFRTHHDRLAEVLAALAMDSEQGAGWARFGFARTLRIQSLPLFATAASVPQELVLRGLSKLRNVRDISWTIRERDSLPLIDSLCAAIASHPHSEGAFPLLESLDVNIESGIHLPPPLRLRLGSRLANAVARMLPQLPRLRVLHLVGGTRWGAVWTALRLGLQVLATVDGGPGTETTGNITGIHLKELVTNDPTDDLITYLASYSGLEVLRLPSVDGEEHLADVLFAEVLPRHAGTLLEFECTAAYEGRWSLDAERVQALKGLCNLRELAVSLNGEDVLSEEISAGERDIIALLLATSVSLPSLRTLRIKPSRHAFAGSLLGRSWWHAASVRHTERVNGAIQRKVLGLWFRQRDAEAEAGSVGRRLEVRVGEEVYVASTPRQQDGGWRRFCPASMSVTQAGADPEKERGREKEFQLERQISNMLFSF
ncbi:F-box domain-containing protein [Mycena chlorophos]|uniref:F-box domain-containing protein n=1 Tax=Mycena chlorophos TaxID=658473 RepID=A0A8H6VWB7_MYCCL|nr:F-box domain-containing protein [Mycena chlorophos]